MIFKVESGDDNIDIYINTNQIVYIEHDKNTCDYLVFFSDDYQMYLTKDMGEKLIEVMNT